MLVIPAAFKLDKRLKTFYRKANRLYFDGKLPDDTLLGWNSEIAGYGLTLAVQETDTKHTFFVIYLDKSKHFDFRQVLLSVLHEMVHVQLHPNMRHGKKFNHAMLNLAIKGAFNDLW